MLKIRYFFSLLLIIILGALLLNSSFRNGQVSGDSREFLTTAHNLATAGLYASQPHATTPGVGREPAYPALLAVMMWAGTGLADFSPDCFNDARGCPSSVLRPAQLANLGLALAAAAVIGWLACFLTASRVAGLVAFAYIALNASMMKGRWEVLSDHLALLLVALAGASMTIWVSRATPLRAALAGFSVAVLVLTKAIFIVATGLALLCWIVATLTSRRRVPRFAWLALMCATVPLGLWGLRNFGITGEFALTDARSGIALSTREVFNHMNITENFCAALWWTRGMGDGLARALCAPETWQPFQFDWSGGYYDVGQNRYHPWVARVMAEQSLTEIDASRVVDNLLRQRFIEHLPGWLATMPALVWRGIWIDEFVVLGFPALIATTIWALRRGADRWLPVLLLGWFNLIGYAAISLNIPRYQISALPALALAAAWLAWQVEARLVSCPKKSEA